MPSVTLRVAMADRIELFERRNRLRIVALVLLATLNYFVAVVMAAIAVGIGIALAIIFYGGDVVSDTDTFVFFAIGLAVIAVGSAVIGILVGLFRIPFLRRRLERRVLAETGARVITADEQTEVRNLLEGLAIAGGLPPPRVAVIDDPAPNSFGVGTRPSNTIVGITTGLGERLSRDELEAVLAYEVSRIRSWDVALSSWTVALTSGAISAVDSGDDDLLKAVLGFVPRWLAESLQVWALRDQGAERDRVAVQLTRNPTSLVRALEKLDADTSTIRCVSRATGPLWLEFPAQVLGPSSSRATRRLARELLLDERIDLLRELAGEAPRQVTR
jgi:heat shock protein HtpX